MYLWQILGDAPLKWELLQRYVATHPLYRGEVGVSGVDAPPVREDLRGSILAAVQSVTNTLRPDLSDFTTCELREAGAIILAFCRPSLFVVQENPDKPPQIAEPESLVWRQRIEEARGPLEAALQAVGRVEVINHPSFRYAGTCWLVREDVVVTNRHIAESFAQRSNGAYRFRKAPHGWQIRSQVGFLGEYLDEAQEGEYRVSQVLHIEEADGPDIAFLRLSRDGGEKGSLPLPIPLLDTPPQPDQWIAVVGYPTRDLRGNSTRSLLPIFGDRFNAKRMALGAVTGSRDGVLQHDCSTPGDSSGSAVLDLKTGKAIGLHFAGRPLGANYAVPAEIIARRLREVVG